MDSYYGGQKEKSDTDKYLDFMRETRDQTKFGDLWKIIWRKESG